MPHRAFTSGNHFIPKPLVTVLRIVAANAGSGQVSGANESEHLCECQGIHSIHLDPFGPISYPFGSIPFRSIPTLSDPL